MIVLMAEEVTEHHNFVRGTINILRLDILNKLMNCVTNGQSTKLTKGIKRRWML